MAMTDFWRENPVELTKKLIFITHQLGMYQAELARVLHLQCPDIGRLATGRGVLEPGTTAWQRAGRFIYFYRLLHDKLQGDEVSMYHWWRAENAFLAGVPHLLIIDDDRLEEVITYLESASELTRVGKPEC